MYNLKKAYSRLATLARTNPKSLDAFILLMYSACATLAKDEVFPELSQQVSARAKDAATVDEELGTEIVPLFIQIIRKNEVDEDEFSTQIRALKKAIRQDINTDVEVNQDHIDMLKALTAYCSSRAEPALRKIVSLAPLTENNSVIDALTFKPNSQKEFVKPLEEIVRRVAHRKGTTLTAEEIKKIKTKYPKVVREYRRLHVQFNNVWKDELRNLINKAGRPMTDFQYALAYLKSQGIVNPLPATFEGNVDANGKFYTKAGKKISNVPGTGFTIKMNPNYDPKEDNEYVFTTYNAAGEVSQHVYTEDYRLRASKAKFEKVDKLNAVIDKMRAKWMQYLKRGGNSVQTVSSTVLELLYQFSARVGTMGNATGGKATYGMATLLRKHFKVLPTGIKIDYPAKDGVRKQCIITKGSPESTWLINNIKVCLKDKEPNDKAFTFTIANNDKLFPVTGNVVNKWFKALGAPEDVTVHKIRHVRGNRLFLEQLEVNKELIDNLDNPMSQAEADKLLKEMATQVGTLLGHVRGVGKTQKVTPMTAIANYISTELMVGYYNKLNLRIPSFLRKAKP